MGKLSLPVSTSAMLIPHYQIYSWQAFSPRKLPQLRSFTLCMALISEGLYVWNTTRHSWLSSVPKYHKFSAEEKWAISCLTKTIEIFRSAKPENRRYRNGRTSYELATPHYWELHYNVM